MALTEAPPAPARGGSLPRLGLAWVTWRQHRFAVCGLLALLAAFAALMVIKGLQARSTYDRLGLSACGPHAGGRCHRLAEQLFSSYGGQWPYLFLMVLPGAFGSFLGGPLIARELETGTYRFAWTQAAGRTRWLVTKLLLVGATLVAVTAGYCALYEWYKAPLDRVEPPAFGDYLHFELQGIVFPAQTLLAFSAGVFAGLLIRRTMVAVGTVFAGTFGLTMGTVFLLRPHYMTPLTTTRELGSRDWGVRQTVADAAGHPVGNNLSHALYMKYLAQLSATDGPASLTYRDWLRARHYVVVTDYQPAHRYWSFQLIESGWMLLLALVLAAATFLLLRRRPG